MLEPRWSHAGAVRKPCWTRAEERGPSWLKWRFSAVFLRSEKFLCRCRNNIVFNVEIDVKMGLRTTSLRHSTSAVSARHVSSQRCRFDVEFDCLRWWPNETYTFSSTFSNRSKLYWILSLRSVLLTSPKIEDFPRSHLDLTSEILEVEAMSNLLNFHSETISNRSCFDHPYLMFSTAEIILGELV